MLQDDFLISGGITSCADSQGWSDRDLYVSSSTSHHSDVMRGRKWVLCVFIRMWVGEELTHVYNVYVFSLAANHNLLPLRS